MISSKSPFFLPVKNDFFKQQFVMKKSDIFEPIQNFMIHLVQFSGLEYIKIHVHCLIILIMLSFINTKLHFTCIF